MTQQPNPTPTTQKFMIVQHAFHYTVEYSEDGHYHPDNKVPGDFKAACAARRFLRQVRKERP
jgi:hypothetical protein